MRTNLFFTVFCTIVLCACNNDNEWHLDYKTWPLKGDGSRAQRELWVNGEKVEEIFCFMFEDHPDYADDSEREVWLYPLYVE